MSILNIPDFTAQCDHIIRHLNEAVSYVGMCFEEPESANVYIVGEGYQELHIVLDEVVGLAALANIDAVTPIVEASDDAVGEYIKEIGMPEFCAVLVTGNILGKNVTTVVELNNGGTIIEALKTALSSHISASREVLKTQTPKRH